jgi:hypothetical protein
MRYALCAAAFVSASGLFVILTRLNGPPPNPPVDPAHSIDAVTPVPPRVNDVLRRACYDCHSSETRWPWYASLPVVSDLIRSDVAAGRAALNFSEWTTGAGKTPASGAAMLAVGCATVEQHLMPKTPYPYMHPDARLTRQDIDAFCTWTRDTGAQLRASRRER